MVGSVDSGSVAVALIGVVVGAVLGFALSWIEGALRRRRRGRAAARLIWMELTASHVTIRNVREAGSRPRRLEARFSRAAWDAERAAFAEVADGKALALVAVAYQTLAWTAPVLAALAKLSDASWLEASEPALNGLLEDVESALTQLDRYSGLD